MNRPQWKALIRVVGVLALVGTVWVVYWRSTLPRARGIHCFSNLKTLYSWMMSDAESVRSLRGLQESGHIDLRNFICPNSGSEPAADGSFVCDYDSVFDREGDALNLRAVSDPSSFMLVWDRGPWHDRGDVPCRYVLFLDGQVRLVGEGEFNALLRGIDELFPRRPGPAAPPGR